MVVEQVENLAEIQQQIKAIVEENKRLRHLRERYIAHAESVDGIIARVREITDDLAVLKRNIDPVVVTNRAPRGKNASAAKKALLQQYFDLMKSGTHITASLIEKHTQAPRWKVNQIMTALAKLPGIDKAKDGAKVRLFFRHA